MGLVNGSMQKKKKCKNQTTKDAFDLPVTQKALPHALKGIDQFLCPFPVGSH